MFELLELLVKLYIVLIIAAAWLVVAVVVLPVAGVLMLAGKPQTASAWVRALDWSRKGPRRRRRRRLDIF